MEKEDVELSRKQPNRLQVCNSVLEKVMHVCQPQTPTQTVTLFSLGMICGISLFILLLFISKNDMLLRYVVEENVAYIDGVPVEVHIEHDSQFLPPAETTPSNFDDVDLKLFWSVWQQIETTYIPKTNNVTTQHPTNNPPTRRDLVYGAIKGLTQATNDTYTNFFISNKVNDITSQLIDGTYIGIGAYVDIREGELVVVKPINNGPAEHAGIRRNDIILEIDGVPSRAYNLTEVLHVLEGQKGSKVALSLYRPATKTYFNTYITRSEIQRTSVEAFVQDGVYIIDISSFNTHTLPELRNALTQYRNTKNIRHMILDLRENPGGSLGVVVSAAGQFIPAGSTVLYEYTGSDALKAYKSQTAYFTKEDIPQITIVVDSATASSAEIFASSLRDHGVADIVGLPTFGKGSVQTLKKIQDTETGRSMLLKITTAHWLPPSKISIEKKGVIPDVDYTFAVKEIEREGKDPEPFILEKAIHHIKQK